MNQKHSPKLTVTVDLQKDGLEKIDGTCFSSIFDNRIKNQAQFHFSSFFKLIRKNTVESSSIAAEHKEEILHTNRLTSSLNAEENTQ